ncbi:MAG: extracellular solute-binding protein [Oscillospiraceae bacterium]|nr:extracellular solute-binding protein [Oscillospiraceae bacterium]
MKKNFLPLLLVLAMMISLLAGCGSTASTAQESTTAPDSASVAEAPEEEAEEAPESDEAEEVVEEDATSAEDVEEVVDDREPITYPLVDEPTTLTYWQAWPPFLSAISEPQDAAMFAKLEEATGVKLEITAVSTETSGDDFMLRCASNDLTDLVQKAAENYTGGGTKAIEDEIIVDLLPLLEEYSYNYWNIMMEDPNFYKNVVNDEGMVPSLIGMYADDYYTDQGFWIRQDLLDKTGKEIPTTIDELDEVLAAFKDLGLTDGLVVLSQGNFDLLARAYDANDKMVDGKYESRALSDNMKDYLKKMNEYYEAGYINADFVTYNWSDTKPPEDVIYNDMGGIFNEDVASIAGYYLSTTNPEFEVAPLAQIRLKEGDILDTGFIGVKAADKYTLSMSTQCEEEQLAIQFMDYLFSEEGFVLANYGIEGDTYTVENGEYKFTDLILNNPQGFDWQLCQSLYINPGFPCLTDLHVQEMTYNDAQKAAVPTWVGAYDSCEGTTPNGNWLSYTVEESERRADLQTDIETYQEEMRLKFITGQADIDATWDEYCNTLKEMGIEELWEIEAAAIDRYNNK